MVDCSRTLQHICQVSPVAGQEQEITNEKKLRSETHRMGHIFRRTVWLAHNVFAHTKRIAEAIGGASASKTCLVPEKTERSSVGKGRDNPTIQGMNWPAHSVFRLLTQTRRTLSPRRAWHATSFRIGLHPLHGYPLGDHSHPSFAQSLEHLSTMLGVRQSCFFPRWLRSIARASFTVTSCANHTSFQLGGRICELSSFRL